MPTTAGAIAISLRCRDSHRSRRFQLLSLHDKSVNKGWEQPRRRRSESDETYTERFRAMWRVEKSLEAELEAVRGARRYEETGDWRHEDEAPPPEPPPLELVTGWSRASGRPAHHEGVALFGGWRIGMCGGGLGRGEPSGGPVRPRHR
jgi:hypothetical protein